MERYCEYCFEPFEIQPTGGAPRKYHPDCRKKRNADARAGRELPKLPKFEELRGCGGCGESFIARHPAQRVCWIGCWVRQRKAA